MTLRIICICLILSCMLMTARSTPGIKLPPTYGWLVKVDSTGKECWHRVFGYPRNSFFMTGIRTADGGYAVIGNIDGLGNDQTRAGYATPWLIVTDSAGVRLWDREFPICAVCRGYGESVTQLDDGGFILSGSVYDFSASGSDMKEDAWVIRTGPSGEVIWTRRVGAPWYVDYTTMTCLGNRTLVLTGLCQDPNHFEKFYEDHVSRGGGWTARLNLDGDIKWSKRFGGDGWNMFYSLCPSHEAGYVFVGETRPEGVPGRPRGWILTTNKNGQLQWERQYMTEAIRSIVPVEGGYLLAGEDSSRFLQMKINSQGRTLWTKSYGPGDYCSVVTTPDHGSLLVGETWACGAGGNDATLIKTDAQGEEEWQCTYGGSQLDHGRMVIPTNDGGYLMIGSTGSFPE